MHGRTEATVDPRFRQSLNGVDPQRQALFKLIEEQPGLNIRELAATLQVARSTARYHLTRLNKADMVATLRLGHHQLIFAKSTTPPRRTAIALLRVASIRALVEAVEATPTFEPAALARQLEISARSVRRSLRTLERAGLVTDEPIARARGAHRILLHPDLRFSFVHWFKEIEGQPRTGPLRTPILIGGFGLAFAHTIGAWFS